MSLTPLQQAAVAIKELRSRLETLQNSKREPIAIIGMSCRFPGAKDVESYWELLREGVDAVREVPSSRWDIDAYYDADPDTPGKMNSRYGAFLDGIEQFDAHFFGISPREAAGLDPQQRLLLEVSWEALERAGLAPQRLAGSRTGVFIGICSSDYGQLAMARGSAAIDAYVGTGVSHSVAAGRLSYVLGLQGPCLAIDTACSSSLVAVSQASDSLRAGQCDLALVGGVGVVLAPEASINFSKARMLAPDGRCKTFDAAADGYVRGEGCGVVVLKRLSDARRDGDTVLAVVRGSAVNQDGRSSGLTVPNGPAQQQVIREALAAAGVAGSAVHYVEAHGTGTALGDPIEVQALGTVLGEGRSADHPLLIGSVKTNIGHLEGAAGIAGLIKVVLSMQHGEVPAHLHFRRPSPHIPWERLAVRVTAERTAWPSSNGGRLAGVSSFGFSGTNAHVVLGQAPEVEQAPKQEVTQPRPVHVLALSARNEAALRELAGRYAGWLREHPEAELADVCYTANTGRAAWEQRAAMSCASAEQAIGQLEALSRGEDGAGLLRGEARSRLKIAFLYTGQGAHYAGVARVLYAEQAVFRTALDACAEILEGVLDRSLSEVLWGSDDSLWRRASHAQPALFAVAHALTELWRSWGVEADAVMGHSLGEYAAACTAGVLTLKDGLLLVAERGRLMEELGPGGAMAAVFADAARVERILAEAPALSLAADNGAHAVLSGQADVLERVLQQLRREGIRVQPLEVSHAFHSALMEPMLERFEARTKGVAQESARLPLILNRTGAVLQPGQRLEDGYWARQTREPVRWAQGVAALAELGCTVLVEIGPTPVLLGMVQGCWPSGAESPVLTASLRRGRNDVEQLAEGLTRLYAAGVNPGWAAWDRDWHRRKQVLPTYPFQRERYWIRLGPVAQPGEHPLLGRRHASVSREICYTHTLDCDTLPLLSEHRVFDTVVVPGAMFAALALAGNGVPCCLRDIVIPEALVLPESGGRRVQLVLSRVDEAGSRRFTVHSAADGDQDGPWALHAQGIVQLSEDFALPPHADSVDQLLHRLEARTVEALYERLEEQGLTYGLSFRGVKSLWVAEGEALAHVTLPATPANALGDLPAHPAVLDCCFQTAAAMGMSSPGGDLYIPFGIASLDLTRTLPDSFYCHAVARRDAQAEETLTADFFLIEANGNPLGAIRGLVAKRVQREQLQRGLQPNVDNWLYGLQWMERSGAVLAADFLPESDRLADADCLAEINRAAEPLLDSYRELGAGLETLSRLYAVQALRGLGWRPQPGDKVETESLAERLGVIARHRRLLGRLLVLFTEAGWLRPDGDGWDVIDVPAADPGRLCAEMRSQPVGRLELSLLQRCGERLAEVLAGRLEPLALLFPAGGPADAGGADQLYNESPVTRLLNGFVAAVVSGAAAALPAGRRLRVLEIGAGVGATTAAVLPELPPDRTDYVFTDISAAFLPAAREKFAPYPFVRYQTLDAEADIRAQGFPERGYDVVLAAQVLHATRDLPQALRQLRRVLAPGGLLVVVEGLKRQGWLDLTFGLLPGWWQFADAWRHDYPLLNRDEWLRLMLAEGFEENTALSPVGLETDQAVLIARAPQATAADAFLDLPTAGVWLMVGDAGGLVSKLIDRLQQLGQRCLCIGPDDSLPPIEVCAGVICLSALDAPSADAEMDAALEYSCVRALHLVQALTGSGRRPDKGLWFITRAAQPIGGNEALALAQAPLWGLGRVVAQEHPELKCRLLDLDPIPPDNEADQLLAEVLSDDAENQRALRAGKRHVLRLVHAKPSLESQRRTQAREGAYLITGGLGGLGLEVAGWLTQSGVRHLALLGRHAPGERAESILARLRAQGCTVQVLRCDVSDADDLAQALRTIESSLPPLRGVVHAAGVLDDGALINQTWDRFQTVFGAKVHGAWNLDRLTAGQPLECFVLFSSMASLLGPAGQGNHAAANAFLDALAHDRRRRGQPGITINWGAWSEVGAAAGLELQNRLATQGIGSIAPAQGLAALSTILSGDSPQVAVMPVDWAVFARRLGSAPAPPLLAAVLEESPRAVIQRTGVPRRFGKVRAEQREQMLVAYLQEQVSQVLGLRQSDAPDPNAGFTDMGMDSLMAVELSNRLQQNLDLTKPLVATALFDHPNINALARHLTGLMGLSEPAPEVAAPEPRDIEPREPIAIVGLSCRFPAGPDPESFWRALRDGVDAVGEVPRSRWDIDAYYDPDPDAPGKMYTREGAFLDAIDRFDPQFFRISPREAESMDPQQRLLLEVSWEAFERAGIPADTLRGSRTGVFVGIMGSDYGQLLLRRGTNAIDAYVGLGTAPSVAAGRLSYVFGLQGPCMAVDTACSSSLVAVHQACMSLRTGECDMALAAGVNAILAPEGTVTECKARMLAADARCKTFDASANGFGRGEGCGVVVLKRLSDAVRDGDPILALVRGSAVNQDGPSSGLTVPNGPSQQAVIRAALTMGGIAPAAVNYVEAHGTGTALGDPIEIQALAAVLGEGRSADRPLLVGSVKTNIGHLEAAAGMAGLIKVVLAMGHGEIPRHLHLNQPNPHIPWNELPVKITTETTAWHAGNVARIAGVSSFGFSGTNAHVVLEEAPIHSLNEPAAVAPPRNNHVLALSARSAPALRELAAGYSRWLRENPGADLADFCFSTNTGRSVFEYRAAVLCADREQACNRLNLLARGEEGPGLAQGQVRGRPKTAFLFTGQGALYPGLARSLYASHSVFREALDRCGGILKGQLDRPLLDVFFVDESLWKQAAYAQPAMFALAYALAELWRSWGVTPDVVLGHSLGEYAAACAAGLFSVEDGLRLVAERGRLMQGLTGTGSMAAVFAEPESVGQVLAATPGLSLAADNGSHSVLSGPAEILDAAVTKLERAGVRVQQLDVSHAFHSTLMEPMLDDLDRAARSVKHDSASLPMITNLTGDVLEAGETLDASYWARQTGSPVQWARCVASLARLNCTVLVEIGASPVLLGLAQECWPTDGPPLTLAPSLRRGREESTQLAESLSRLYVAGLNPDWKSWDRGALVQTWQRRKLVLPTYPFQRQRYWIEATQMALQPGTDEHPLLGRRQRSAASGEVVYATSFSVARQPWLTDHRLSGSVLVPGAVYAAMGLTAGSLPGRLGDLAFYEPLILPEGKARDVQLVLTAPGADGSRSFQVLSAAGGDNWTLHAKGMLESLDRGTRLSASASLAELQDRMRPVAAETVSAGLAQAAALGLELGPAFNAVRTVRIGNREVLAELAVPESMAAGARQAAVHPALLDACTQVAAGLLRDSAAAGDLFLPVGYGELEWYEPPPGRFYCHATHRGADDGDSRTSDLEVIDESGRLLGRLRGLVLRRVPPEILQRWGRPRVDKLLYHVRWQEKPVVPVTESSAPGGTWLVLTDTQGVGCRFAEKLVRCGKVCVTATPQDFDRVLTETTDLSGLVFLWGLGAANFESARHTTGSALHIVQALARLNRPLPGGLWLCTRGAHAVLPSAPVAAAQTSLWGLGRTVALEQPQLNCTLLDLDREDEIEAAAFSLAESVLSGSSEPEQAWRANRRYVPRLERGLAASTGNPPWLPRPRSSYLITGGLGALGLATAKWLVAHGADSLVLMGRRPNDRDVPPELRQNGCTVTTLTADVADSDQLGSALTQIEQSLPPLRGIIHAAGVIDDALIEGQSGEGQSDSRLAAVLAPKVQGAWNLHTLTRALPLDFFVMYSSAASVLGSPAQSGYAAANAFMDGLAYQRRAEGLSATVVNWGPWAGAGMAARDGGRRWQAAGLEMLSPEQALAGLEEALGAGAIQTAVLDVSWPRLRRSLGEVVRSGLLENLLGEGTAGPRAGALLELLKSAAAEDREAVLMRRLQEEVQQVLGLPGVPDPQKGFFDLGMDSLMAVEIRNRLYAQLGNAVTLPSTALIEFPTVETLTAYLLQHALKPVLPDDQVVAVAEESSPLDNFEEELDQLSADQLLALMDANVAEVLGKDNAS